MARAFGTIESAPLDDGSASVRGRFLRDGARHRVVFGLDVEGWTEARARQEMENIRVLLRAGMPIATIQNLDELLIVSSTSGGQRMRPE